MLTTPTPASTAAIPRLWRENIVAKRKLDEQALWMKAETLDASDANTLGT